MDTAAKGPICDDSLMTDVEGVFTCGNAMHVNDLVDYVSESGERAGKNAAHYTRRQREYITLETDPSLLYLVPQRVETASGQPVVLYFRSSRSLDRAVLEIHDGEHILYINGAYENKDDNSDLAKLIHDFRCSKADEMLLSPLADRTRFFKETPEGVDYMCKAMEERITEEKLRIAYNLLQLGTVSKEDIAKATKLPIEAINELEEEMKNVPA